MTASPMDIKVTCNRSRCSRSASCARSARRLAVHGPAQQGNAEARGDIEDQARPLVPAIHGEAAARRNQEVSGENRTKGYRGQSRAKAAIPGGQQDREEQGGVGELRAQRRISRIRAQIARAMLPTAQQYARSRCRFCSACSVAVRAEGVQRRRKTSGVRASLTGGTQHEPILYRSVRPLDRTGRGERTLIRARDRARRQAPGGSADLWSGWQELRDRVIAYSCQ